MPKSDPALRDRAVRLALEHGSEYPSLTAYVDEGTREGVTSAEHAEIKRLMAENSRLREDVAILRAATTFFAGGLAPQPLMLGFIDTVRAAGHAVESIIRVLREQDVKIAAHTYRAERTASSLRASARNESASSWTTRPATSWGLDPGSWTRCLSVMPLPRA